MQMGKFKKGLIPWNKNKTKEQLPQLSHLGINLGNIPWNKGKKYKISKKSLSKGKHYSLATEFKKRKWKFKGTLNEYRSLHKRINKKFGKLDKCEDCGKNGLTGKQIHWANISGNYEEERKDWKRLCVKCHYLQGKSI